MPIEIKELIIRASVRDASDQARERGTNTSISSKEDASQEERIVNRCVEQVMNILRIQNER